MTLSLEWVAADRELEAVRADWDALAERALEPNPFYEAPFLLPALRHLRGSSGPVEVALVRRAAAGSKELVLLAPCERRRRTKRLPVASVGSWRHDFAVLGTPLVAPDAAEEAVALWLDELARRAPLVELHRLGADGEVGRVVDTALAGSAHFEDESYGRPLLRTGEEADALLARTTSSRRRSHLRRQWRLLGEAGEPAYVQRVDPERLDTTVSRFLEMEDAGWKGRAGTAMARQPGHADFFRDVMRAFGEAGRLDVLALELDGEPIALRTSLRAGDTAFTFKVTYDERYKETSPGVLLEVENLKRVLSAGELAWMDSCASLDTNPMYWLWEDSRRIETRLHARRATGRAALALLPHLVQLARRRRGADGKSA